MSEAGRVVAVYVLMAVIGMSVLKIVETVVCVLRPIAFRFAVLHGMWVAWLLASEDELTALEAGLRHIELKRRFADRLSEKGS